MNLGRFLGELRRRRVLRVLAGYGLAAFAILQVAEPILHALRLQDWILTAVVLVLGLGFPVAVALAWAFDVQPGGVARTPPSPAARAGNWEEVAPVLLLGVAAAAPGIGWVLLRRDGAGEAPAWLLGWSVVALLVALFFLALMLRGRGGPRAGASPAGAAPAELPAVAVLPFADLSQERDQDYFCDGIAEELLGALCGLSGLRVVSRSSSFQFKGQAIDVREVGRTLGATTLLEGSVRREGRHVRVSARLVDARQGFELWSGRFDREVEDTFAVQEEIAQAVVRALQLRLTSQEERRLRRVGASRSTRIGEAYDLYLRGRHQLMQLSDRRVRAALACFRQAVALDPGFAQAHAGVADATFVLLQWNLDLEHAEELRAEALHASEEALRLDPELAEARLARANVLSLQGRHEEAERDFRRAMALNPGWGDACYFYGRALFGTGRYDEAAEAYEEAARRNPDDFAALSMLEGAHVQRRDAAAARAAGERALAAVERRLRLDPDDARALYLGAIEDVAYGDRERGLERMERAVRLGGDDFSVLYNAACFHARLGQGDRALDLLDRAVGPGRGFRRWIENDGDLEPYRADRRFQAILARVRG
jgi:adenylate cyclase